MMVCCVFSLELPHGGNSYECTQHTIMNIKKKIIQNYPTYSNACSFGTIFDRDSRTSLK